MTDIFVSHLTPRAHALTKLTAAMLCGGLLLVGCGKKDKNPEPSSPEVKPLVVQCDEASTKNRLMRDIQMNLDSRAIMTAKAYEDSESVGLERRLGQRLTELSLDLQQVGLVDGESDLCQADVQVNFTSDDIRYASEQADKTGGKDAAELLATHSMALSEHNRIVIPLRYRVTDTSVTIERVPAVFDAVASILTMSAYGAATDKSTLNLNGREVPVIEPVEPVVTMTRPRTENIEEKSEPKTEPKPESKTEPKSEPKADNRGNDRTQGNQQSRNQERPTQKPRTSNERQQGPAAKPADSQRDAGRSDDRNDSKNGRNVQSDKSGQAQGPAANQPQTQRGPAAQSGRNIPISRAEAQNNNSSSQSQSNKSQSNKSDNGEKKTKAEEVKIIESNDTY